MPKVVEPIDQYTDLSIADLEQKVEELKEKAKKAKSVRNFVQQERVV
jgi:hypothetical protein